MSTSRPRKGAWIEIPCPALGAMGHTRRPRKGAWIEIGGVGDHADGAVVAPARGRGLKSTIYSKKQIGTESPPQGGVD